MTQDLDTRISALVHPRHGRADECAGRIPHADTYARAAEFAGHWDDAAWYWWVAGTTNKARHALRERDAEMRYCDDWADHEGVWVLEEALG